MIEGADHPYHLITDPETHDPLRRGNKGAFLRASGLIFISSLILLGVFLTTTAPRTPIPQWTSCGSSPLEARSRGCSFDIISFSWQTPECHDASLISDFLDWGDWDFYTDFKGNMTVPLEEAWKGDRALWVSWDYHVVHCTFMWRLMHRSYERGWISETLHSYDHTLHCQDVLLDKEVEAGAVVTKGELVFPDCLQVGSRNMGGGLY